MVETGVLRTRVQQRSIVGLDLIRFLAAALVVVYHLGHRAWAPPVSQASIRQLFPSAPAFPELESFTWLGWVGVQIFFVISGFVIANSAERASPYGFLRSRILRLTPGILICATVTLLVLLIERGPDAATLQNYGRTLALPIFPRGAWIDSVYWTIVVELVFYAAIFALLAINRFSLLPHFAMALGLASSALWFGYALFGFGDWFLASWAAKVTLARYGCYFAAGVLLWLIVFKEPSFLRIAILVSCLSAGVLEIDYRTRETIAVIGRDFPAGGPQALFLFGVAAMLLSVRLNGWLQAHLGSRTRVFTTLGLMTYPLYLIHNVVGVWLLGALADRGLQAEAGLALAATAMIVLAWIICRWAEPAVAAFFKRPLDAIAVLGERAGPLAWLFRSRPQAVASSSARQR